MSHANNIAKNTALWIDSSIKLNKVKSISSDEAAAIVTKNYYNYNRSENDQNKIRNIIKTAKSQRAIMARQLDLAIGCTNTTLSTWLCSGGYEVLHKDIDAMRGLIYDRLNNDEKFAWYTKLLIDEIIVPTTNKNIYSKIQKEFMDKVRELGPASKLDIDWPDLVARINVGAPDITDLKQITECWARSKLHNKQAISLFFKLTSVETYPIRIEITGAEIAKLLELEFGVLPDKNLDIIKKIVPGISADSFNDGFISKHIS